MRQEGSNVGAKGPQHAMQKRDGSDPVYIVITVQNDGLAAIDPLKDPFDSLLESHRSRMDRANRAIVGTETGALFLPPPDPILARTLAKPGTMSNCRETANAPSICIGSGKYQRRFIRIMPRMTRKPRMPRILRSDSDSWPRC